nr:MAG TPA: hypothetical protein [Caudoviricetes sp.]
MHILYYKTLFLSRILPKLYKKIIPKLEITFHSILTDFII